MWTDEGEGKVLYVQTHGVSDPGRCATPFFLAASAAAMEVEVGIYFTMYGPTLLQKDVVDKIGPKGDQGMPLAHFIKQATDLDRKSTRLNSSHGYISYAVFCLKKKKKKYNIELDAAYADVMQLGVY